MADYIGQNLFIRPHRIVSLPEYSGSCSGRTFAQMATIDNLKDNSHRGLLSSKAISNLETAVNWLLVSAEPKNVFHKKWQKWFQFKVNFITLTLPDTTQIINNQQFQKRLLNPFLTVLRTYHGLGNYVWKLEFQSNGKLHVHLCTDSFIHHATLRSCWNAILGKNNFLIDFAKKFGHTNPNSIDVHSVRKINNLAGYICKYMSKQAEDLKKIKGRIWGCSQNLSQAIRTRLFVDRDNTHHVIAPLMKKEIEFRSLGTFDKFTGAWRTFGEVFFMKFCHWRDSITGELKQKFLDVCNTLRGIISDVQISYEV